MATAFKHNRKRNSGLTHELLVRRMGASLLERDQKGYSRVVGIIRKYFSPGQAMAKEKELFDAIVGTRGVGKDAARRVLEETRKHALLIDPARLDSAKSNLIKDVHTTFGKEFFGSHRISDYRLYASVQMLIERYRRDKPSISEDVQRIQLEEALIKTMSLPVERSSATVSAPIDSLVAALAMKKFEERYSGALVESQRRTLRRFMDFSMAGNHERFDREMSEERNRLLETLRRSRSSSVFAEDKVMSGRMDEALERLEGLSDLCSEESVKELLMYERLVAEVESDG